MVTSQQKLCCNPASSLSLQVEEGKMEEIQNLSHADLVREMDALSCFANHHPDLQLAAELGKTLLERNRELENTLKLYQNAIEEKNQEIEYLTKQTTVLRKTNDDRILLSEQLDGSIQELERANRALALDNSTDKKQIQSLQSYRDTLELRCEDLQRSLQEATAQLSVEKEKFRQLSRTRDAEATRQVAPPPHPADDERVTELLAETRRLKEESSKDQRKIADLEEEMCRQAKEMALLKQELGNREDLSAAKSLEEEEVRLCDYCLQEVDAKQRPDVAQYTNTDDRFCDSCRQGVYSKLLQNLVQSNETPDRLCNGQGKKNESPYRHMVERYEALWAEQTKMQRKSRNRKSMDCNHLSLQEELKMSGEFCGSNKEREEDEESGTEEEKKLKKQNAAKRNPTPTDFSEAETSSSGFADEISNKETQTEGSPGSFLCAIDNGDVCKFTIYDGATMENRFRRTPEYRSLFREIFAVLKRAAEACDDGGKLALRDDLTPTSEVPKVPQVTPATEDLPVDFEDLLSLPDSVGMSEVSEVSSIDLDVDDETALERTLTNTPLEDTPGTSTPRATNDIIEFMASQKIKKGKKRSNDSPARKGKVSEAVLRMEADGRLPGRKRKNRTHSPAVTPHVLTTLRPQSPSRQPRPSPLLWGAQTFVSKAALEVAQLKRLEKTYAEVLRHTPQNRAFSRVYKPLSQTPQ